MIADPLAQQYLAAVLAGNRRSAADLVVAAVDQGRGIEDVYTGVFHQVQVEVGRLWEDRQIPVATEHMATAITQYAMSQVYARMPPADRVCGRLVLTGVQGELHQMGGNMIADVLEGRGWDVRFLGTNTPTPGVLQAIEEHRPDVVGISATMVANAPAVRELVQAIRARFPAPALKLVVGGSLFRMLPELAAEIHADGVATDVPSAVALMTTLASRTRN